MPHAEVHPIIDLRVRGLPVAAKSPSELARDSGQMEMFHE